MLNSCPQKVKVLSTDGNLETGSFKVIPYLKKMLKPVCAVCAAGGRVDAKCRRDRRRLDAYLGLWGAAGRIQEGGNRPHPLLLVHWPGKKPQYRSISLHLSLHHWAGSNVWELKQHLSHHLILYRDRMLKSPSLECDERKVRSLFVCFFLCFRGSMAHALMVVTVWVWSVSSPGCWTDITSEMSASTLDSSNAADLEHTHHTHTSHTRIFWCGLWQP